MLSPRVECSEQRMTMAEEEMKEQAKDHTTKHKRRLHRKNLRTGLLKLARVINDRMNPAEKGNNNDLADRLEKDNDKILADRLEKLNSENAKEVERKSLCREAQDACLQTLKEHLQDFLHEHPQASYEQWILDVHPENESEHQKIDHRFYVEKSDHRELWNDHLRYPSGIDNYVHARKRANTIDD